MLSRRLNTVSRSEIGTLVCKDTDGRFEGSLLTRYRYPGDMAASQARSHTSGDQWPHSARAQQGRISGQCPRVPPHSLPSSAQIRDELLSPGPGPSTITTKLLIRAWCQELSSTSGLAQSSCRAELLVTTDLIVSLLLILYSLPVMPVSMT